uniref:Uncharacterized protein n=1 Tax=Moniliophthora roreri TaxID=221103 RepID=A0A0W0G1D4_MONRR
MSTSLCAPVLALDTYRTPVHAASASRYTNSNPNVQSSSPNSKITETGGYTMQQFSEDDSLKSLDGSVGLKKAHLVAAMVMLDYLAAPASSSSASPSTPIASTTTDGGS